MSINSVELKLILAVQEGGDSAALEALVTKYKPMIVCAQQQYFIKLFDDSDWEQEARIVCYETCLLFQASRDCQFGAFFKLRFYNHIRSLLRHDMALKRRCNQESLPLENYLAEEGSYGSVDYMTDVNQAAFFELSQFLKTLSYFELQAFRVLLRQITAADACVTLHCSETQLQRAIDRCHAKMRNFLD